MSKLVNKDIIYFSRFFNNPSGNGGDRRAAQICQVLSPINYTFICMHDNPYTVPFDEKTLLSKGTSLSHKLIRKAFKQHITYNKYNKWSDRYRDNVLNFHFQSRLFIKAIKKHNPKLLLIDDPVFLTPIVYYAKSQNIPLVALCHNLETLSREQVDYDRQKEMFTYELDLISKCNFIVTISREETFILKNFGMDPYFFPYYPVEETAARFRKIRNKRQYTEKSNFLLLGTVGNLPTLDGMKRIITMITQKDVIPHNDVIIVAGFGTTMLQDFVDDSRVQVRGQVSDAALDEILTETKGCIVYQENGSGALTKFIELLVAGVPVISNSHAARSHYNLPGVFEFSTPEQLREQIIAASAGVPIPEVFSQPSVSSLQQRIQELIDRV